MRILLFVFFVLDPLFVLDLKDKKRERRQKHHLFIIAVYPQDS